MISVEQATQQLLAAAQSVVSNAPAERVENVALNQALGRVLASSVVAACDVPPAANSAMDGYAFCWQDAQHSNHMPVSQRIAAGQPAQALKAGSAARIFTGATIPDGADTVAMQENCCESDGNGKDVYVEIDPNAQCGANVRAQGQDIVKGSELLVSGCKLRPQELGLLASVGVDRVTVYKRLTVAIFSTGDELVEPGQALKEGQIYNSNRSLLTGLLQAMGCDVLDLGCVPDNHQATLKVLRDAADVSDVIISSGGVSVGEEDHVKAAVSELGALDLWKVAIKPGKPLAFGHIKPTNKEPHKNTPFIGLPGNPASVLVTFSILARPFLLACQGLNHADIKQAMRPFRARALFDKQAESRQVYLRAKLTEQGVQIHPKQSSGMLSSACWGDVLCVQNVGEKINQGDWVQVLPYLSSY